MIKVSLKKVKNQFDELIGILKSPHVQEQELFVSVKYGALCISVHTCKEQLKQESQSSKEILMKNQKAINLLNEVENRMYAKANGPFKEITESVYLGFDAFRKLQLSS